MYVPLKKKILKTENFSAMFGVVATSTSTKIIYVVFVLPTLTLLKPIKENNDPGWVKNR
jgi:hypothetical protein